MVKILKENCFVEKIDSFEIKNVHQVILRKCFINSLDLIGAFDLNTDLIIENCFIENLLIHSCWFNKGLILKNNHISNYVDYQMGGHNNQKILIEGNIFLSFVNFFDCQFKAELELKNNLV